MVYVFIPNAQFYFSKWASNYMSQKMLSMSN